MGPKCNDTAVRRARRLPQAAREASFASPFECAAPVPDSSAAALLALPRPVYSRAHQEEWKARCGCLRMLLVLQAHCHPHALRTGLLHPLHQHHQLHHHSGQWPAACWQEQRLGSW